MLLLMEAPSNSKVLPTCSANLLAELEENARGRGLMGSSRRPFSTLMLFALLVLALLLVSASAQTFDVLAFGAKGDGRTDDTVAIRAAAAALQTANGGVLLFQPGYTFLTLPFNLSSNSIMLLEGNIVFHPNMSLYNLVPYLPSYGSGRENASPIPGPRYEPQLGSFGTRNVTIMGGGSMDGNGAVWWAAKKANKIVWTRPHLVEMNSVHDLKVIGISLKNSPFWTLHPVYCKGVLIEGITVSAPVDAPETDCIDPDSSQDVVIRNVDLQGGDDCIAIKSGMDEAGLAVNMSSANILIENSRMGPCGAISFGSESSGGIHNVTVRNIVMQATDAGFYIKSGRGRGGVVQNLHLENVQVQSALIGMLVSMYYTSQPPSTNLTTTPQLHNVTWTNVTGNTVLAAGQFCCLSEMPCTHLDLQQVKFTSLLSAYTNCEYAFGSADSSTAPSPMNCLQPGKQESSDLSLQWQSHLRSRDRGHVANNPLCHAH